MMKYARVVIGDFANRGRIISMEDFGKEVMAARETKQPLYRSYYLYDEEVLEHFKIRNTIRSFKGDLCLDRIVFDIDKHANTPEITLTAVRVFVEGLKDDWHLEDIAVWFSGSGYHVIVPNIFDFKPSPDLPVVVKATLNKYFPEADDIYDAARIIRAGYTLNYKTNLYKVPLKLSELFTLNPEQIAEKAKIGAFEEVVQFSSDYPIYEDLKVTPQVAVSTEVNVPKKSGHYDIVTCMRKCYDAGEVKGKRHERLLRIISAWARAGLPYNALVAVGKSYAPGLEEAEIKKIVQGVLTANNGQGYRYSCQDKVMMEFCDPKCIFFKHKNYTAEVSTVEDMESRFVKFTRTATEEHSIDLGPFIGLKHPFFIHPKELFTLIGDTGLGKTAFLQNVAIYADNLPCLYLNLEIGEELFYRRLIQIKYGMSKSDVDSHYTNNDNTLSHGIRHIQAIHSSPFMDVMDKLIIETKPKLVVIDTVEDIIVKGVSALERMDAIAKGLKSLANTRDVIIGVVHHISKSATKDSYGRPKALDVHSGKGSSTLEQKADKVISIEGNRDTDIRVIKSQKARDEIPFVEIMKFDKGTFRFIRKVS